MWMSILSKPSYTHRVAEGVDRKMNDQNVIDGIHLIHHHIHVLLSLHRMLEWSDAIHHVVSIVSRFGCGLINITNRILVRWNDHKTHCRSCRADQLVLRSGTRWREHHPWSPRSLRLNVKEKTRKRKMWK